MTQELVDKMPKNTYKAASSNPDSVPVRFYGTGKVAPRSELGI
ncbi:hypothetical protein [Shewanella sp. Isolate11]|nr:hypothetical protein [Shewanella sp. Isolate11]